MNNKRILIAAPKCPPIASKEFQIEYAETGAKCLEKLLVFRPDLVFLDLMLPEIHGIEILRRIRLSQESMGVIITSDQTFSQNFRSAISLGADDFLQRPYSEADLLKRAHQYFAGTLKTCTWHETHPGDTTPYYAPDLHAQSSYIKFWGTRGSNAVAGPEYIRFGGNTSCLEVRQGDDLVIIDAGTGIRALGNALLANPPPMIHIFLSHTHMDHLAGLSFFSPLYHPECKITLWSPIGYEKSTKDLLTEMFSYSYFPVSLEDIASRITLKEIREGIPITIGNLKIDTTYAYHPGATVAFKVQMKKRTFGYATDNEALMGYLGDPKKIGRDHPLLEPFRRQIEFFSPCDFIIHEAQYTPLEYETKIGWGHSSLANASVLIKHTNVREWIVTHHDPSHTDEDLQKKFQLHSDILEDCDMNCRLRMAYDSFAKNI